MFFQMLTKIRQPSASDGSNSQSRPLKEMKLSALLINPLFGSYIISQIMETAAMDVAYGKMRRSLSHFAPRMPLFKSAAARKPKKVSAKTETQA